MTFKLAHLSDLHIGYSSGNHVNTQGLNLRMADGMLALNKTVSDIIQEEVDAVVVAGDVFHGPAPSIRQIVFVQNQMRRFWEADIPVYLLAGNHDSLDQKQELAATKVLDDPYRNIYSSAETYVNYEIADGIQLHLVSHHLYSMQADTMAVVKPFPGEINIFSTHGSVVNPLTELAMKNGSPREVVIPETLLRDEEWDYTLLGHIHERGFVGSKDLINDTAGRKIFYNGSLIRRGFSDQDVPLKRGWTLWNISESGLFVPEFRTVPQRPQFDFPVIDAAEMNAQDISDLIIDNLKSTQVNGNVFNGGSAPIIRQRIANITSHKYKGLDFKEISNQSKHAMSWNLKQLSVQVQDDAGERKTVSVDSELEQKSLLDVYDGWVHSSKTMAQTSEDLKKIVQEQTREFIKLGQEKVFEEE